MTRIRAGLVLFAFMLVTLNATAVKNVKSAGSAHKSQMAQAGENNNPPLADPDFIDQGKALYERRCGACHSLDQNRVGPKHRGVYGRKAGAVAGYRYSDALRALNIVWRQETLEAWLKNPTAFAPGTSMGFRLRDPEQRRAIIAYLRALSDTGSGN